MSVVLLLTAPSIRCLLGCDPDSEEFEVDEMLSADELDEMLEKLEPDAEDWTALSCEAVCGETYADVRGWEATPRHCELELPDSEIADDVGRIVCSGTGFEYLCK